MLQNVLSVVTGALVVIIGIFVQRILRKHDAKLDAIKTTEAESKRTEEERLTRMERTLNRHTKSLSALSRANKISVDTLAQHANDLEELEDATEQLHTAVDMHLPRIEASERYIAEIREQRQSRG